MKAEIQALEKMFAYEIERAVGPAKHNLPFQSRAAIYKRLAAGGLVDEVEIKHGAAPFSVRVKGYELTHAGRMLYCSSCDADDGSGTPGKGENNG